MVDVLRLEVDEGRYSVDVFVYVEIPVPRGLYEEVLVTDEVGEVLEELRVVVITTGPGAREIETRDAVLVLETDDELELLLREMTGPCGRAEVSERMAARAEMAANFMVIAMVVKI